MHSGKELTQFKTICENLGNEVADESGFVPVRNLLSRFQVRLVIRPLLVEAMLASVAGLDSSTSQWAILLDSETYSINDADVQQENRSNPLPSRLRNTVAHELVHSLAFRPTEFGIRLTKTKSQNKIKDENLLVKVIEDLTEKLSPLLLWPETTLNKFLADKKESLSIEDFIQIRRTMGISRYVLINRLKLISIDDKKRSCAGLYNIAIGRAEWSPENKIILRKWPLFINFENHVIPKFLITLMEQDRVEVDWTFGMSEGKNSIELEVDARTVDSSTLRKMKIECSIEKAKKIKGQSFLFVIRKL